MPGGRRHADRREPRRGGRAVGAGGSRWWRRYATEGWVGLRDRPSTPQRRRPVTLRAPLSRPTSTVGTVLRRLGHSRRPRVLRSPVVRHERAIPGELLHLDTKKLGSGPV